MASGPVFEWDDRKAKANEAKHGVTFEEAMNLWLDAARAVEFDVTRDADGEHRTKRIGLIENRLFAVTFTMRGTAIRLISARRANAGETREWR